MSNSPIVLQNRHLEAHIDEQGRLIHLSAAGNETNYVRGTEVRYHLMDGQRSVGQYALSPTSDEKPLRCTNLQHDGNRVTAKYAGDHMALDLVYELTDLPLLRVTSTVRGTGAAGKLQYLWAPRFNFAPGFNEQFEDPVDLYDDGAELAHGIEMPCWRVFFRAGHKDGLLLATRCKADMSRFNVVADGFEVQPQARLNYSTNTLINEEPLQGAQKKSFSATYELAPWSRARHATLLRQAKLDKPLAVKHPPAQGKPPRKLKGKVFHAAKFAPQATVSAKHATRKWHVVNVPWSKSGKALFASTGVAAPPITFNPKLKGLYHVYAGVGNGEGLTLRASGDPEARIRIKRHDNQHGTAVAWMLCLSGKHQPGEVDFGVMKLDGRTLRVGRFPDLQRPCMFDYLRFEKLDARATKQWEAEEQREPRVAITGLFDCPDVSTIMDAKNPDPRTYAANIWEHANSRVRRVFYRIDGQCSDFPSKNNTMRYVSAKVHGVFSPHSKAYGRVLQRADILRIATDAGKKYGVAVWGWMRFNNYTGNVQSDFFKKNPQFHEEWDNGRRAGKLCLLHPEVRQHKISILVEAAKNYDLPGLCLGFMRHPPILTYAKPLCEAYEKEFGQPPPRDPKHPDPARRECIPDMNDSDYVRWWTFRARYLTLFGRELRAALQAAKLGHVKIAIWLRANHCLFDGIDLPTWLDEKLCDEVMTMTYTGKDSPVDWPTPQWIQMVKAKVPVSYAMLHTFPEAKAVLPRILAAGFSSLGTYESNDTVLESNFIQMFRGLRR